MMSVGIVVDVILFLHSLWDYSINSQATTENTQSSLKWHKDIFFLCDGKEVSSDFMAICFFQHLIII
jgi:hypothetical protein